MTLNTHGSRGV